MNHMDSSIMSHMDINIGLKSYIKEKVTNQARIPTKVLRKVHSNLPATVSAKLWRLDTLIYQELENRYVMKQFSWPSALPQLM